MAWRIDEQVIRGEIDNRTRGRVVGKIWLHGRDEPMELDLIGNAWRDLAGHVLKFTNPSPVAGDTSGLTATQRGTAGDITASRKVKVPECSMEELMEFYKAKQPFPWHWGNSLYLEWYSKSNGRVVIESAFYQLALDTEPAWIMTDEDEAAIQAAGTEAMADFMRDAGMSITAEEEADDDLPQSAEEAAADEEDARMQLLLDRVTARMARGDAEIDGFDRIYEEERARLMKELGEKEPEQEAERQAWIQELNEIAMLAELDLEAEKWKGEDDTGDKQHPLVEKCCDLTVEIYKDIQDAGWIPPEAQHEHPLLEVRNGVQAAAAKLAGALGTADEWPPDRLIAGNVIVRLKKTRDYLRDALSGLDSADEENLADLGWRKKVRARVVAILEETEELLRQARAVLGGENEKWSAE